MKLYRVWTDISQDFPIKVSEADSRVTYLNDFICEESEEFKVLLEKYEEAEACLHSASDAISEFAERHNVATGA